MTNKKQLTKEELLEWLYEAGQTWADTGFSGGDRDKGDQAYNRIKEIVEQHFGGQNNMKRKKITA